MDKFDSILEQETKRLNAINNVKLEKKRNKAELVMATLTKLEEFFNYLNGKYNFHHGAQKHMVSGGMANIPFDKERFKDKISATFGLFTNVVVISVDDNFNVKIAWGYKNNEKAFYTVDSLIEASLKKIAKHLSDLEHSHGSYAYTLTEK